MDFIAIDFETANLARSSPCALGMTEVREGQIGATETLLIRPPDGFDRVDPYCEAIHGITQGQVNAAPPFDEVWPGIQRAIGGKVVVAHNAAFDTGVIRDTLDVIGTPWPDIDYVCTMIVARRVVSLDSYRLPFVTEHLGIDFSDHHEPGADSRACAEVILRLATRQATEDVDALLASVSVQRGVIRRDIWRGCRKVTPQSEKRSYPTYGAKPTLGEVNADADPDHPLFGARVCFTGSMQTMGRQDAWDRLCAVGGLPEKGVTKKTTILVVGTQDPRALRPGVTRSSKEEKAASLRAAGQEIEIMGEDDFIALVVDPGAGGERPAAGAAAES